MHTVQLMLIDASNIDTTDRAQVERYIEAALQDFPESSAWFDWWAVGGRWEDYLKETVGPMVWPNQLDSPVALKLTRDNWPMAIKLLGGALGQQGAEVATYVKRLKELNVDLNDYILNLEPLPESNDNWCIPYYIHNIFKIKQGEWTSDSGYADLTNWQEAKPGLLLEYLKNPTTSTDRWNENIEKYALVVVDFHF